MLPEILKSAGNKQHIIVVAPLTDQSCEKRLYCFMVYFLHFACGRPTAIQLHGLVICFFFENIAFFTGGSGSHTFICSVVT
jgi:hypothetical protein